jgi:hypothetical protein
MCTMGVWREAYACVLREVVDRDKTAYISDAYKSWCRTHMPEAGRNSLTFLTPQQVFDLLVSSIFRNEDPARQFYRYDVGVDGDEGFTWRQLVQENRVPATHAALIHDVESIYHDRCGSFGSHANDHAAGLKCCDPALQSYARTNLLRYESRFPK